MEHRKQEPIVIGTRLNPAARLALQSGLEPWLLIPWFRKEVVGLALREAIQLEALIETEIEMEYATEADFTIDPALDVVSIDPNVEVQIQALEVEADQLMARMSPLNRIRRLKLDAPIAEANPFFTAETNRLEREVALNLQGPEITTEIARIEQELAAIPADQTLNRSSKIYELQAARERAIEEVREKPLKIKRLREQAAEDLRRRTLQIKRDMDAQELALREESEQADIAASALLDKARTLRERAAASERLRQRSQARATYIEKARHSAKKKERAQKWETMLEQARLFRVAADFIADHGDEDEPDNVTVSPFALARHSFLVGKPGFGKTRLITHLLKEQMRAGHSVLYIDPKPDATRVLVSAAIEAGVRPENIIILDPLAHLPVAGWNPLLIEGIEADEAASALKDFIHSLSKNSWGVLMDEMLDNAITIGAHHRLSIRECIELIENAPYRHGLLAQEPISGGSLIFKEAVAYFRYRFTGQESSVKSVTVRLRKLLEKTFCWSLLCARENTLDLAALWRSQKVVIARLDQAVLSDDGARVIAGFLANQMFLTAMQVGSETTNPVVLAMDELGTQEKFIGERLAEITSFSRSQGLRLLVAAQYFHKISPELLKALLGIADFQVYFRLALDDAEKAAEEMAATIGTVGKDPPKSGADISITFETEFNEHTLSVHVKESAPPRLRPAPDPVTPFDEAWIRTDNIPPTFNRVFTLTPPIEPVRREFPKIAPPPKSRLSYSEEAIVRRALKAYKRHEEIQESTSFWGQFLKGDLFSFTSEENRLVTIYEEEAARKEHKENERRQYQEYYKARREYPEKYRQYKVECEQYQTSLNLYHAKLKGSQLQIAHQQEVNQQEAVRHWEEVRSQETQRLRDEFTTRMHDAAKQAFPFEPRLRVLMGLLWAKYDEEDYFVTLPVYGEIELVRFLRTLPPDRDSAKPTWTYVCPAEEEVCVVVHMPSVAVSVAPIAPLPNQRSEWAETLFNLPDQTVAVRSTGSKGAKPFATLCHIVPVADALPEDDPELWEALNISFSANSVSPEKAAEVLAQRLQQIDELAAEETRNAAQASKKESAARGKSEPRKTVVIKPSAVVKPGEEESDDGSF